MIASCWLLLGLAAPDAEAAVRRIAMVVGNNDGDVDSQPLYFAEDDALKMEDLLTEIGGYDKDDVWMLLGESRHDLLQDFGSIRRSIISAQNQGDEVVFLFYYSGHANDEGLELGRSWLSFEELERMLDSSGADVRMAFIDACNSGQLTRRKGGTMAPSFVFDVSERLGAEGTVIITSSTGDEASQESDEIGGSYFTHYLVGAMSGAADSNADDKITLSEAYEYVYRETVLNTRQSSIGTQHPTFEWDLSGEGDVVLTDLSTDRSSLLFSATLNGTFAVFDIQRRAFVGEVASNGTDRRLAVGPGTYLVQVRHPTYLQVAEVKVREGQQIDIDQVEFKAVEYENDQAKGMIDKRIQRARMPDSTVRLMLGATSPVQREVLAAYYPAAPLAGLSYRGSWARGQWFSVDLMAGTGTGTIVIPNTELEPLGVRASTTTMGLSAGYMTESARFGLAAGAGVRFAGLYMNRSFEESSNMEDQFITSLAPGWVWYLGWHPGRLEFDLEWQRMVVPYSLDDTKNTFGARNVLLSAGLRW